MVAVFAQSSTPNTSTKNDPFVLIPTAVDKYGDEVEELGKKDSSGEFWDIYNDFADGYTSQDDIGAQVGSGIMNWDTILGILGRVVIFLANGALVVGAAMIIYAGYLYVASVFAGDYTSQAQEAIKRAIIGIVIVIFSYAILRWIQNIYPLLSSTTSAI